MAMLLELEGYQVECAFDGQHALDCVRDRPPDALLLDIGLPRLDGLEVARRLRAQSGEAARKRLLVVRLIAQHQMTTDQIARVAGVSRKSVFNYRDLVVSGGIPALLRRDWAGGPTPVVRGAVAEEFIQRLEAGQFRQVRDAKAWIKKRTRKTLS
jgi:CheY-like chemotaxis protein